MVVSDVGRGMIEMDWPPAAVADDDGESGALLLQHVLHLVDFQLCAFQAIGIQPRQTRLLFGEPHRAAFILLVGPHQGQQLGPVDSRFCNGHRQAN